MTVPHVFAAIVVSNSNELVDIKPGQWLQLVGRDADDMFDGWKSVFREAAHDAMFFQSAEQLRYIWDRYRVFGVEIEIVEFMPV